MKSYSIIVNNNENTNAFVSEIKETISNKLDLLINILFNQDKFTWFGILNIQEYDTDALKHYEQFIKIIKFMDNIPSIQEIPISLVENFSQNLLLTPELNIQINKLIKYKFGQK